MLNCFYNWTTGAFCANTSDCLLLLPVALPSESSDSRDRSSATVSEAGWSAARDRDGASLIGRWRVSSVGGVGGRGRRLPVGFGRAGCLSGVFVAAGGWAGRAVPEAKSSDPARARGRHGRPVDQGLYRTSCAGRVCCELRVRGVGVLPCRRVLWLEGIIGVGDREGWIVGTWRVACVRGRAMGWRCGLRPNCWRGGGTRASCWWGPAGCWRRGHQAGAAGRAGGGDE